MTYPYMEIAEANKNVEDRLQSGHPGNHPIGGPLIYNTHYKDTKKINCIKKKYIIHLQKDLF